MGDRPIQYAINVVLVGAVCSLAGCSVVNQQSKSYYPLEGKTYAGKAEECIIRRIRFVAGKRVFLTFYGAEEKTLEEQYIFYEDVGGFMFVSGEPVSFTRAEDRLKINFYSCPYVYQVSEQAEQ
ncbi:hypothetical protein [Emcibacter nanhaiensis]|uniref:Uncharacterized protein n=1 Tax=Emcibacter nanhaiensis TaxID=1505037 RepID=A0A501PI69_9PROT|nr:hypothetical protein [Emcibacter nanhaiensis]TPD59536.1 hypothetical protein FIV46_10645 [Emcibacter nanhaiensis]